jgi:serine/threonine-protein kinase
MLAAPFDLPTLRVTGAAVPIIDGVFEIAPSGAAKLAVSMSGTIAYVGPEAQQRLRELVWVDRHGVVQPLSAPRQTYEFPRLSPDGTRIAVGVNNGLTSGDRNIWLYDLTRGTLERLTSEKDEAETPAWTPDGRHVTYSAVRPPGRQIMWTSTDGSESEQMLAGTDRHLHVGSWSPTGDALVADIPNGGVGTGSLWILRKRDAWTLGPFLKTSFEVGGPVISPDGQWLAYESNQNNRYEIYLQAFPGTGSRYPVSTDGGHFPVWARNGRELFYRNVDKMMAVSIDTKNGALQVGKPTALFHGAFAEPNAGAAWYDVSTDGQRFLMLKVDDAQMTESLVVIQDWMDAVKRLAPPK